MRKSQSCHLSFIGTWTNLGISGKETYNHRYTGFAGETQHKWNGSFLVRNRWTNEDNKNTAGTWNDQIMTPMALQNLQAEANSKGLVS